MTGAVNGQPSVPEQRAAVPHPRLRVTALAVVAVGVVLLAAAAFVLSYAGIRDVALAAGVRPLMARLYPVLFDAVLVVTFAAALALRGAGWWTRCCVRVATLVLLAAVAAAAAVGAMGLPLPRKPAAATAAVIPWALLLLAFALLLAMLRQPQRSQAAAATGGRTSQPDRAGPGERQLMPAGYGEHGWVTAAEQPTVPLPLITPPPAHLERPRGQSNSWQAAVGAPAIGVPSLLLSAGLKPNGPHR